MSIAYRVLIVYYDLIMTLFEVGSIFFLRYEDPVASPITLFIDYDSLKIEVSQLQVVIPP